MHFGYTALALLTIIDYVDKVQSFTIHPFNHHSSNNPTTTTCIDTTKSNKSNNQQRREKIQKSTKTNTRSSGNTIPNKRKSSSSPSSNNRKEIGYSYRNEGIKVKRKRPPRWEVEGDSLFFLQNDENDFDGHDHAHDDPNMEEKINYNELFNSISNEYPDLDQSNIIEKFLHRIFDQQRDEQEGKEDQNRINSNSKSDSDIDSKSRTSTPQPDDEKKSIPNHMMWGGTLPVGPILKSKLQSMYNNSINDNDNNDNSTPTPIQQKAFQILTKKHKTNNPNVVIASPTGSGKTLAYILPLLSTSSRKEERTILILTPTLDLSFQIQKVISQLWDDNSVYVMTDKSKASLSSSSSSMSTSIVDVDSQQIMEWNIEEMLLLKPTIIASTPKILLQMISTIMSSPSSFNGNNKRYMSIFSNLKTIVLDEADRLLQTELLARYNHELKNNKNTSSTGNKGKLYKITRNGGNVLNDSPTIQLFNMMKRKLKLSFDVQQQSQKHPIQLICASATVGRTLRHQIMEITNASSIEKGSVLITADDRTGKDERKRKNSLLPDTIQHFFMVSNDVFIDEGEEHFLVESLQKSMNYLDPGTSIIFPGKVGVQKVAELLSDTNGFQDVRTLRNSDITLASSTYNNDSNASWENTPLYVIGEKFGRGLDIPNVKYVFISSPPTSPAAYAHLAGRCGRAGKNGVAVTLLRDFKEAKRLLVLSIKLGLQFGSINQLRGNQKHHVQNDVTNASTTSNNNVFVAEEDFSNLTVEKLKEILKDRGLRVSGKKSELISRLKEDLASDNL